jgi:lipopolysaccharide export system ATP-binding protein
MNLMETKKLKKSYKGRAVVDGVSIGIQRGEIVGLLGPNGAGKTTTFYMMVGVIPADSGSILFRGEDITALPMYQRARLGIGYLSQEPSIFRKLTVEENIMAILESLDIPQKERDRRLVRLLDELDIAYLAKSKAYTLSGGERRRLEITRALVTNPSLILLDEPFRLSILLTDHSVRETLAITDRSYLLCDGKVEVSGTSQFLASDPKARELYLGEKFTLT